MKLLRISIIFLALFFIPFICMSANQYEWTYETKENEMGEEYNFATVMDNDPEYTSKLALANLKGNILLFIYTYDSSSYGIKSNSVDIKVDQNEIHNFSGYIGSKRDSIAINPDGRILKQLMNGESVKVRIYTFDGIKVIDFTLNGSLEAIGKLISGPDI